RVQQEERRGLLQLPDHVRGAEELGDLSRHRLLELCRVHVGGIRLHQADREEVLITGRPMGFSCEKMTEGFFTEDLSRCLPGIGHDLRSSPRGTRQPRRLERVSTRATQTPEKFAGSAQKVKIIPLGRVVSRARVDASNTPGGTNTCLTPAGLR